MISKFKKWLGIEGVKVKLTVPSKVNGIERILKGTIKLESLSEQKVSKITVRLIEKYQRGRKKERLLDEYTIGEISFDQELIIQPDKPKELDFILPFQPRQSEIDEFGDRNILTGGLAKLAKMAYSVNSSFRVEAEIFVEGVALNPFDKKFIDLK